MGGNLPYAQSVDDPWSLDPRVSPWAKWEPRVRTQAQLAAAFGMRDVVALDLTNRTTGDALATVTATDSVGTTKAIADAVRLPAGAALAVGLDGDLLRIAHHPAGGTDRARVTP